MKKKINVQHQHRYTLEKAVLFHGEADFNIFDDYDELVYKDQEDVKTVIQIHDDYICIKRNGEIQSNLVFIDSETTSNTLKSEYGDFEVELHTYQYKREKHNIIVEYDVLSSESKDGFKIEIEIMEDINEFN